MNENYILEESISEKFCNISEISSSTKEQNLISRNINNNNHCKINNQIKQRNNENITIRNNNINQNKSDIIDRFLSELENKVKSSDKCEDNKDDDEEDEFEKAEKEYRNRKNNNNKNISKCNSKQKDSETYSKILNEDFSFTQENSKNNKKNSIYKNKLKNNPINLFLPLYQRFNNKIDINKKQKYFEPKINVNPGKIYLNASVKQGGTTIIKKINQNFTKDSFDKISKNKNKNAHIINGSSSNDHNYKILKINFSKLRKKDELISDNKSKKDNSSYKNNSHKTFRANNINKLTPVYIDGLILKKINNSKKNKYSNKHNNSLINIKTLKNYYKYKEVFVDSKTKKNKNKYITNLSTIDIMKYHMRNKNKNKNKKCNSTNTITNTRNKNYHYKKSDISQIHKNSYSTMNIYNPYSTRGFSNSYNYLPSKNNNKYLPIIHDEKLKCQNVDFLGKTTSFLKISNNKENLKNQEFDEEIHNSNNNNGQTILFKNYGEKSDYIIDNNEIFINKENKINNKEEHKEDVLTTRKINGKINLDNIREVTEEN